MANKFLKPTVIANTAVGLLYRELVVARTLWTGAINPGEFNGAFNDTVTMRVPARRTATKRTLRAGTAITAQASNEYGVAVKLDTDIYNAATITDEELGLDITDFAVQILNPQIKAVVEGLEDEATDIIEDTDYDLEIDPTDADFVVSGDTDWYRVATRARRTLNENFVPRSGRTLLVGAAVEEEILNSDRFTRFDSQGQSAADALTESKIGRIAGFDVIPTTSIDEDSAFAYHKTAFVLATRAPRVPQGATSAALRAAGEPAGGGAFYDGLSLRWLMDYDYANTTDRSLVDMWSGTAIVEDPITPSDPNSAMHFVRAIAIREGS